MDLQAIKLNLIHWVTQLQDRRILEQLHTFKQQQKEDLSESHKALLDERISSCEKDPSKMLDWEDVVDELEKDLKTAE